MNEMKLKIIFLAFVILKSGQSAFYNFYSEGSSNSDKFSTGTVGTFRLNPLSFQPSKFSDPLQFSLVLLVPGVIKTNGCTSCKSGTV